MQNERVFKSSPRQYRQVKKDMQEIQRAKYDIDQFLKSDEEQKKERVRKHNITIILIGNL